MTLEKHSPCKVNLLLNVLRKRADGFHELETVLHPVNVCDLLSFERGGRRVQLTCSDAALPTNAGNLVHRAAMLFRRTASIRDGVRIHLEKRIPLAAGLGGGSGDAATTLVGMNELFGKPLSPAKLHKLASTLGSDVPFFLQSKPALATGRGERIQPLDCFPALKGTFFLLIHPGFGISSAWAYKNLARFPEAVNGKARRAKTLISILRKGDLSDASHEFYNSLEAPALEKFPILALYQEFLRENGALAALMSGSGSTTFALVRGRDAAETLLERFKAKFGLNCWTAVVGV
jgi:4-diphosphocytidyl-2-C-methyl-D-erythritol kinase